APVFRPGLPACPASASRVGLQFGGMSAERRVGSSGLLVSAVGLGCNNFGRAGTATETLQGTVQVLDAAIDHGVTFLDTADMYGKDPGLSETLMGEALRGRRDQVVLRSEERR